MWSILRYSKYKNWRKKNESTKRIRDTQKWDKNHNHEDRARPICISFVPRKRRRRRRNREYRTKTRRFFISSEGTGAETNIDERRTAGVGTKPQCQPIDLHCSLRGPLLRREKNKLIGRGGREAEERRSERQEREEIALFMNEKKEEEEIRIRGSRREMQNERERERDFVSLSCSITSASLIATFVKINDPSFLLLFLFFISAPKLIQ